MPSRTAPALRRAASEGASSLGTKSAKIFEPEVVRTPAEWTMSLAVTGMPMKRAQRIATGRHVIRSPGRSESLVGTDRNEDAQR